MGVFSRLADIINANLNSMLDRAEDPEKMLRLIIQEMEDTLVEVRSSSARLLADRKEGDRKLKRIQDDAADWLAKAELAMSKGRDDLARAALLEREETQAMAERLKAEQGLVDEQLARLGEEINQLEAKLQEAKNRQQTLLARRQTAQSRLQVREQLAKGKVDDTLRKLEQFERKIDDIEALAEVQKTAGARSLQQELAELASADRIDQQMAELRQRLAKGQTTTGQE